ncbi:glycosyltransferase family 4 protein [bacterium]|nr:glycosyltransferase family 4 protein [bacterium]MBU3930499.1 glycosyltransferase family 4 protein [bacterium]
MTKIRILHILWSGVKGGAEKNVADIATGLSVHDFDTAVLFMSKKDYWGNFIESKGIKTYCLHLDTARSLRSVFVFVKFAVKSKYDIYHNHIAAPFVKIILKILMKRVIQTMHNNPDTLGKMSAIKRELTIRFADFYIAPSKYIKGYLERQYNIKSRIIYHGIEITPLMFKKNKHTDISICKIGVVTHLEKMKGNDILINAAKMLTDRGIFNFKIFIAGIGTEYNRLKSLIDRLSINKYVSMCGNVTNINDFLNDMDVFASASLNESLGISVLEAMGRGLPIVCTNIPAFSEIVHNEGNGFICYQNPQEISEKLEELINDRELRKQFGEASYKIVVEMFNLDIMLNKYKEFYLKCAE